MAVPTYNTDHWDFTRSTDIPQVGYSPPIQDLFANFAFNWQSLKVPMMLLLGIFFAFYVIKRIIKHVKGDDDD